VVKMILDKIIQQKKQEITQLKESISLEKLKDKALSFSGRRSFKQAISKDSRINLIAEIKKASPSKGMLKEDFNPVKIAEAYEASGASCLSILTDKKFFQGDISYLQEVRDAVKLPILRKDFIIDKYQVYESICSGADAVLLIAQVLTSDSFKELLGICTELKIDALCEVHNQEDLDKVLTLDCEIIGINNRNLQTFDEDLKVTEKLIKRIPKEKLVVSESAIKSNKDVRYLESLGCSTVLIGETFMRADDIKAKVVEVMGNA